MAMDMVYIVQNVWLDAYSKQQTGVRVLSYDADTGIQYGSALSSEVFDLNLVDLQLYKGYIKNAYVMRYGVRGKDGIKLHRTVVSGVYFEETPEELVADIERMLAESGLDTFELPAVDRNIDDAGFDILEKKLNSR